MRLPPRGSAQDELLFVLHKRSLELKFTETAVITGILNGQSPDRIRLLELYRQELWEESYRPDVIRARRAVVRKKHQDSVDQAKLLAKVAKYGAGDDDKPLPTPKKKRGR